MHTDRIPSKMQFRYVLNAMRKLDIITRNIRRGISTDQKNSYRAANRFMMDLRVNLVPQIDFQVIPRAFPDVGFRFTHVAGSYPARFRVKCDVILGDSKIETLADHYSGEQAWNLNPGYTFYGHKLLHIQGELKERLEIDTTITIIDRYDREHQWLPVAHVYDKNNNTWFGEPCPFIARTR